MRANEPSPVARLAREAAAKHGRVPVDTKYEMTEPNQVSSSIPKSLMPQIYDNGGDVNVHDGHHQLAILQEGERVLTPKENKMYKAGLNPINIYDDGGDVLSPEEDAYRAAAAKSTGLPSMVAPVEPAEKPRGTDAERKAIETDKQNAMGKGADGLMDLGIAKIHENHLTAQPPEGNMVMRDVGLPKIDTGGQMPLSSRTAPGLTPIAMSPNPGDKVQTKAGGPLISAASAEETPSERRDFAGMAYKGKLADYDKQIQAARDAGDGETATRLAQAKMQLQASNPYGSESNHPGFLGKLAHIAGTVGNIAGNIVAPSTMALIPGTAMNKAAKAGGLQKIALEEEKASTERDAEENAADKSSAQPSWKEVTNGAIDPRHPELGPQQAFYNEKDPTQMRFAGAVPPKEGAAASKPATVEDVADYKQRISNSGLTGKALQVYGSAPAGATKAELDKRFDEATKLRGMNATDVKNTIDEQARKDAAVEHQREHEEARNAKLVNYQDKNGDLVSGTREEALAAGVNSKDIHGETSAPLQEKARQAYTQYGRILENTQAAMDTMPAWSNETDRKAAMDVSKQYWDHMSINALAVGGGINPEYTQQLINSDAYKKMSPEGREHMQNMFQLWSDAINIVKQETGGVPRGQVFLQKEDAILPHPDKTPEMNEKSLQNLAKRIRTDSKEYARPSDIEPLGGVIPSTAQGQIRSNSTHKLIGYVDANGVHRDFDGNKLTKE